MNRRAFARSLAALPAALAAGRPVAANDASGAAAVVPGEMPMTRGNPAHTGEHPGPGPAGDPFVLWRFSTNAPLASSPAVSDGVVFFGSDDGYLFAVDASDGTAVWGNNVGNRVRGTPAVRNGRLYVANGAFNVHDEASGRLIAQVDSDRFNMTSSLVPADVPDLGSSVFGAGMRGASGFVDARAPLDGRTRWRHDVVNHMTTVPAVAGNAVYFGTLSGELVALDAATGASRWQVRTAGGVYAAPAVADDLVYVTSWSPAPGQQGAVVPNASGTLYAVDAETGAERWRAETGNPVESGPAVTGGLVVVGGGKSVYAFAAATGSARWQFETGDLVRSTPALTGGVVYVGSGDGHLYAIEAATGEPRWVLPVGAPLDTAPAVVDGLVFVTCGNALLAIGGL